ncbi:MAG: transporter, partial [Candidatus Binataceae bacterium]
MKLCLTGLLIIISAGMFCGFAGAEESGSGHYLPGATSSFIDMLPDSGTSTFAYLNAFTYYHGSTGASRDLELGGQVAANVKGTVYADTSIFLYQAPWTLLSGQYGAAVAVPYVWMNVKGNLLLTTRRGRTFGRQAQGTDNSFGDIELLPLMFGWKESDLKWQGTFGIYAPTGDFKKGALANVGTNYWTFEPGAAASYL